MLKESTALLYNDYIKHVIKVIPVRAIQLRLILLLHHTNICIQCRCCRGCVFNVEFVGALVFFSLIIRRVLNNRYSETGSAMGRTINAIIVALSELERPGTSVQIFANIRMSNTMRKKVCITTVGTILARIKSTK